jgi:hypothetical protein
VARDELVLAAVGNSDETSAIRRQAPDLQRWSDVSSLQYYHHMDGNADGTSKVPAPRWIVRSQIKPISTDTIEAIAKAHALVNREAADWPGVDFDLHTTEEAFMGLLGTTHGQGPGFFLTQHKQWFGNMEIDKIKIWLGGTSFYMAFSVVPVPGHQAQSPKDGPQPGSAKDAGPANPPAIAH